MKIDLWVERLVFFGYSVLMASNFETTSLNTSYWINVSSDNEFSPQVSYDQYWNLNIKKNLSRLMVSKKKRMKII